MVSPSIMSLIVYDSLCNFSQFAAYMNFAVQIFKPTASPCERRPPLEPAKPSSKSIKYSTK